MKKVTFEELTIENFLSFGKETTITFKNGINIITGVNKDKDDANGVGKSTIIDAFYYCLFGTTLKELKKEEIVNDQIGKNCKASLTFSINDNGSTTKYKIIRGISPSFCTLYVNDTEVKTLSTIPATNTYIYNLMATSPSVFKNTITMALNNSIPFMAQRKNEKREFIEGIFKLEIFKQMNKIAKENYESTFKDYDFAIRTYTEYESNIKNYTEKKEIFEINRDKNIKTLNTRLNEYLKANEELKLSKIDVDTLAYTDIENNIKELFATETSLSTTSKNTASTIAVLESKLKMAIEQSSTTKTNISNLIEQFKKFPKFGGDQKTIEDFTKHITELEKNIETARTDQLQSKQNIDNASKEIQKIKNIGSFCDKCNRPYAENDVKANEDKINNLLVYIKNEESERCLLGNYIDEQKEHIEKSKIAINILQNKETQKTLDITIKTLTDNLTETKKNYETITIELDNIKKLLEQKRTELSDLRVKIQKNISIDDLISNNLKTILTINKDIEKTKNEKNQFDELITDIENKKNDLSKKIEEYKEYLAMYDIIKLIVSDDGAKTYIIKKLLSTLNERINYYLNKMETNCTLTFDEYFDDKIINDKGVEKSYESFSQGERKRIDLACLFAFMDIRRIQGTVSFNLAFYDELLDSALSSRGTEKVFEILQERVQLGENSYIITHKKENLKNPIINGIIYLEKIGGITRLGEYK